jgi:uncharacterized protein (TIGR00288 family)
MIQTPTDTRSRIAVFIDFDNVEIGVKSTIGGQFDIGLVLEAIKERGEIVTKIAYSDWKRVGDYSRLLTQHAIRMVQRNMTPGGDKNGADITMALDALEMAFTHDHINAFVIVGGDSDFISLVEKLKQYGRKVIVVGGRQFTSVTMQRNCHEFIAYENLVGSHTSHRRQPERGGKQPSAAATGGAPIAQALPLVLRALKVLSEREVTPQLGLLKSTLLQLDSTFSEREFGAGSFRDFMEKVAVTGAVELKHAGRSMLVEAVSGAGDIAAAAAAAMPAPVDASVSAVDPRSESRADARSESRSDSRPIPRAAAPTRAPIEANGNGLPVDHDGDGEEDDEALPPSPMSMQDGIKAVQHAFGHAPATVRWPMYVRQARQFLRSAIEGFDERKYGFASVVDLLRAAGKENVLRIERDRQGAVRVFPGANLAPKAGLPADDAVLAIDEDVDVEVPQAQVAPESFEVDQQVVEGTVEATDATLLDDRYAAQDAAEDAAAAAIHGAEGGDEDGPQPGNELHPRPSSRRAPPAAGAGGRKRKTTSHAASSHAPSRAPRTPRAAPAGRPARPRARKAAKPRSGGD